MQARRKWGNIFQILKDKIKFYTLQQYSSNMKENIFLDVIVFNVNVTYQEIFHYKRY